MKFETHSSQEVQDMPSDSWGTCEGDQCRTGICPLCVVVWGTAAILFAVVTLLEAFL